MVLAQLSILFVELFKIAPNSILPNLKLQAALKAASAQHAITKKGGANLDNWGSDCSGVIRMVATHYKKLAEEIDARATCFKKVAF